MNQTLRVPIYFPSPSSSYPPSPPFTDESLSIRYPSTYGIDASRTDGTEGYYGNQFVEELDDYERDSYEGAQHQPNQAGELNGFR